jgi:antitoxin component YwqK of YwqJK toxin-antitoxin module
MTRITICGIAAIFFCSIAGLIFYLQAPPAQPDFAPGTTVRIFLPDHSSSEKIRYERYAADRVSRTVTDIEYVDGSSEQITYWGDNNLRRASVKYFQDDDSQPAASKQNKRVKSRATFDHRTGQLYTSHQVYRLDGTLERTGELLSDGRYQTNYYWSDGKTLSRQRIFNQSRVYVSEKIFREDGSLLADVVQGQSDQREIVLYWPNGARQANYSSNLVNGARGTFFAEDGVTVVCEFYRSYWSVEEIYYNSNGQIWQKRLAYRGNGSMTISLFAADGTTPASSSTATANSGNTAGTLVAVQFWKMRPTYDGKPAYKVLSSVALYSGGQGRPYRIITFSNGQPDGINAAGQDVNGVLVANPAYLVEPLSSPIPEPGMTERGAPKLLYDYE